jgi:hypothetical protein
VNLQVKAPVVFLYRGDLRDTAVLVTLAQIDAPVSLIAFSGELDQSTKAYLKVVNEWLRGTRLPQISIHPNLTSMELERLLVCPLKAWGWEEAECEAAILRWLGHLRRGQSGNHRGLPQL